MTVKHLKYSHPLDGAFQAVTTAKVRKLCHCHLPNIELLHVHVNKYNIYLENGQESKMRFFRLGDCLCNKIVVFDTMLSLN